MQQFNYSLGNIDPTKGTIAKSQKAKFDEMKQWVGSPLHDYQCKKEKSHFILAKKDSCVCNCDGAVLTFSDMQKDFYKCIKVNCHHSSLTYY